MALKRNVHKVFGKNCMDYDSYIYIAFIIWNLEGFNKLIWY